MIPYGRQSVSQADVDAVVSVLQSDYLTQGPVLPRFEAAVAETCGAGHAVGVNSATSALHIACLALDVGPGDLVWTVPNTFVASANCARYCGADVDFVDIDPETWNMDVADLEARLERAAAGGRLPKVVIPVHFAGQPCDMVEICTLARRYGFAVIEDASHAIGARYRDTRTGDCAHSHITVFSFHPVKIVTTAEGGMATTTSPELAGRMRLLRSHGVTREPAALEHAQDPWYYEQHELGFNYRLTELQAALGLSQLGNLEAWIARRHRIADRYDAELAGLPLQLPVRRHDRRSALHLYPVRLDDPARRRAVFDALREAGIGVNVHYIPVHTQPYYRRLGFAPGQFPASEAYYAGAVSLPMYPAMTDEQQSKVISEMKARLG
jgi:UDP-4-amino-4,6-dideoxy-N-acetyl-beta-L-altrosamine transaminase